VRRAFLLNSVSRVLGADTVVHDAAYMWNRQRWMVPYGAVAFAAVVMFAPVAAIEEWPTRIAIGFAAAGVAVMATTEHRIVAETNDGPGRLRSRRVRRRRPADRHRVCYRQRR
jgi:hypothetical protein